MDNFEKRLADAEAKREAQIKSNEERQTRAAAAREQFIITWSDGLRDSVDFALAAESGEDSRAFGPRGSAVLQSTNNRTQCFRYLRSGDRLAIEITAAVVMDVQNNFVGVANTSPPDPPPVPADVMKEITKREQQRGVLRKWGTLRLKLMDQNIKNDPGFIAWFFYSLDHGSAYPNLDSGQLRIQVENMIDRKFAGL